MPSRNSIAGKDDTAPRVVDGNSSTLKLRSLSTLVLVPPALAVAYLGSPYLDVLLAVVAVILAWEWDRLCGRGRFRESGVALMVVTLAAVAAAGLTRFDLAVLAAVFGLALVYGVARLSGHDRPAWSAAGVLYIALPCVAFAWLRSDPNAGVATAFWLVGSVAASDIGAYFTGRAIGGPRLAPNLSPHKTWAGLFGGIAGGGLAGAVAAGILASPNPPLVILISGLVALTAQAGDLLESAVKRRFGVKDTSAVLPGHGGLFDRLDSLLVATPAVVILTWFLDGGVLV